MNYVSKGKSEGIRIFILVLTSSVVKRRAILSSQHIKIRQDYDVSIKYIANDFTNPSLSRDLIILTIDNKELFISEIKNFGKTHSM